MEMQFVTIFSQIFLTMTPQSLDTLSVDELKKKEKVVKTTTGVLIGSVIVMIGAGLYLTIEQGFNAFTILPIAFLPMLMMNFRQLKAIRAELAKRA
jgi:uncharacterized membrane protein YccF (DUF307 family)